MPSIGLIEFELWSKGDWPRVEVVGESFYADALRSLFPRQLDDSGRELLVRAALVPDPTNQYDRNAVKIMIDGKQVGHLPKEDAARYQPVLAALVQRGFLPVTNARVWGSEYSTYVGTDRRDREILKPEFRSSVSVTLDEWYLIVPMNEPPRLPHAMLPYGAALQVRKEENHQDILRRYVNRQGQCWVYGTLHSINEQTTRTTRDVVEVRIDGQRVGDLTPAMSSEFVPIIGRLAEVGRATGVRLIVKGNQVKAEVVLHAQRAHQLDDAWIAAHLPAASNRSGSQVALRFPTPEAGSPLQPPDHAGHPQIPPRPRRIVFAVPPGWPPAPAGWEPPPDWRPDPTWPPAPSGWQFWRVEG